MNQKYDKVPSIITGKDLDYLSDMFNWNYIALKKAKDFKDRAQDSDIITALKASCELFNTNLNIILSILNEGGLDEQ